MKNQEQVTDQILHLDPALIDVDDAINVRPYTTSHDQTKSEQRALEELMTSIQSNGQEQPVVVVKGEGEQYRLVFGNRRLAAIRTLNANADEANQLKIQAVVRNFSDPIRAAFDENDKRQAMNPMDKAMNFQLARNRNNWLGAKGTVKVAEYFGVSKSTVIQHDKLLAMDDAVKNQVLSGDLTVEAALVAAGAAKAGLDTTQLIADAKEIETAKQDVAPAPTTKAGKKGKGKKATKKAATKPATKTRKAKGGKTGVSASSMKQAARKQGAEISRSRKDILAWVAGENGPAYPQVVQDFLNAFIQYADGKIGDRALANKFEAAVVKK